MDCAGAGAELGTGSGGEEAGLAAGSGDLAAVSGDLAAGSGGLAAGTEGSAAGSGHLDAGTGGSAAGSGSLDAGTRGVGAVCAVLGTVGAVCAVLGTVGTFGAVLRSRLVLWPLLRYCGRRRCGARDRRQPCALEGRQLCARGRSRGAWEWRPLH